jgi:hypothetical protein
MRRRHWLLFASLVLFAALLPTTIGSAFCYKDAMTARLLTARETQQLRGGKENCNSNWDEKACFFDDCWELDFYIDCVATSPCTVCTGDLHDKSCNGIKKPWVLLNCQTRTIDDGCGTHAVGECNWFLGGGEGTCACDAQDTFEDCELLVIEYEASADDGDPKCKEVK